MGPVELASCAFGQSSKISYLEMAAAVCAVVNGGKLMQPYLVSDILAPDGTVLPCQSWLTGKGLGNLLRTPWPRIWRSHECRAIREESAKMAQRCQLGDTPMQEGCR